MITIGDKVKIEDIGELATCVSICNDKYELEMYGERFWISKEVCSEPAMKDDEAA